MKLLFRNKRHGKETGQSSFTSQPPRAHSLRRIHLDGGRIKEGFLLKHQSRRWRRLWIVLRDTAFVYYEEKPKNKFAKPTGLLELNAETTVRKATSTSKPFVFEVVTRPHVLVLKAASQRELDAWFVEVYAVLERMRMSMLAGQQTDKTENRRGWLVKRAVRSGRNWRRRFFVLSNGRLCYFNQPPITGKDPPIGVLEFTPNSVVSIASEQETRTQMLRPNTLIVRGSTTMYLAADDQDDLIGWISAIERSILRKVGIVGEDAVQVALGLRDQGIGRFARKLIDQGYSSLSLFRALTTFEVSEVGEHVGMESPELAKFEMFLTRLVVPKKSTADSGPLKSVGGSLGRGRGASIFNSIPVPARSQDANPNRTLSPIAARVRRRVLAGAGVRAYAWGDSTHGKLGLGNTYTPTKVCRPMHLSPLHSKNEPCLLAAGDSAMAAVTAEDGRVFTWGSGGSILGLGEHARGGPMPSMPRPHIVMSLRSTPMRTVSVASTYMAAVSAAGDLYTWGLGLDGQLGHGSSTLELSTPHRVDSVGSVADPKDGGLVDVVCSTSHLVCLSDSGKVYTCGKGQDGRLGHGDESNGFTPRVIQRLSGKRIGLIAAGDSFTVAVTASGKDCYSWGSIQENTMGALVPTRLDGFLNENQMVTHVNGKGKAVAFVVTTHARNKYSYNNNKNNSNSMSEENGEAPDDHDFMFRRPASNVFILGSDPSASARHSTGSSFRARRRGRGGRGALDDVPRKLSPLNVRPMLLTALTDQGVVQVSCGGSHIAALCWDGRLLMWGRNTRGQLASGDFTATAIPSEVVRIVGYRYVHITCGSDTTAALAVRDEECDEIDSAVGDSLDPPPRFSSSILSFDANELEVGPIVNNTLPGLEEDPNSVVDGDSDLDSDVELNYGLMKDVGDHRLLSPDTRNGSIGVGEGRTHKGRADIGGTENENGKKNVQTIYVPLATKRNVVRASRAESVPVEALHTKTLKPSFTDI